MFPLCDAIALSEKRCHKPIVGDLKYASSDNFMGRVIDGYDPQAKEVCLLLSDVAESLCQVQNYLLKQDKLGLVIYDAYRPKRAALDMYQWSQQAEDEFSRKKSYYPHIDKSKLFDLGYIGLNTRHSTGDTVDVFLWDLESRSACDMGACFDFFGELSHFDAGADQIGEKALLNRQILREAMEQFGFISSDIEFWHFSLGGNHTGLAFDEPISPKLKA